MSWPPKVLRVLVKARWWSWISHTCWSRSLWKWIEITRSHQPPLAFLPGENLWENKRNKQRNKEIRKERKKKKEVRKKKERRRRSELV